MRYLVTSALPYINGVKHLGNLIGSILPADVYTKFLRQMKKEVLFICGTDEHGTPAEIAAFDSGKEISQFCREMHQMQYQIYKDFKIDFDYFGRTSSKENADITQEVFLDLEKNGLINYREIVQLYDIDAQKFLPDRYVVGVCPKCRYEKARGDQCDSCGDLLDPLELINPKSSLGESHKIEQRKSTHAFLRLDKIDIENIVRAKNWSHFVKSIAFKWIKEGLTERCITRDLKWGIKVPNMDKVFYVWFDAPNGYISITQEWAKNIGKINEWKKWWTEDDVEYTQFMAKDNVAFHAIFWPAVLHGTSKNWHIADNIKSFHWLTYNGGKFSTSNKRGIFTDTAIKIFPADYWRYYLIANAPETSDSDFTFTHFASIINKDLADVLGNFINRTLSLFKVHFDSKIPQKIRKIDAELLAKSEELIQKFLTSMTDLSFRAAAAALRQFWVLGNEFITIKQPWKVIKEDRESGADILLHAIHLIRMYGVLMHSIMPETSSRIMKILNCDSLFISELIDFRFFGVDHVIEFDGARLFNKITDEEVIELTERFG